MKVRRYPLDLQGKTVEIQALDTHMRSIGLPSFTGVSSEQGNLYLCSTTEPESGEFNSMMFEFNSYLDTL